MLGPHGLIYNTYIHTHSVRSGRFLDLDPKSWPLLVWVRITKKPKLQKGPFRLVTVSAQAG